MLTLHKKTKSYLLLLTAFIHLLYKIITRIFFSSARIRTWNLSTFQSTYVAIYLSISYLSLKSYCSLTSNYLRKCASKYSKESDFRVIFLDATIQFVLIPKWIWNRKRIMVHSSYWWVDMQCHDRISCFFPHETIKRYASL